MPSSGPNQLKPFLTFKNFFVSMNSRAGDSKQFFYLILTLNLVHTFDFFTFSGGLLLLRSSVIWFYERQTIFRHFIITKLLIHDDLLGPHDLDSTKETTRLNVKLKRLAGRFEFVNKSRHRALMYEIQMKHYHQMTHSTGRAQKLCTPIMC